MDFCVAIAVARRQPVLRAQSSPQSPGLVPAEILQITGITLSVTMIVAEKVPVIATAVIETKVINPIIYRRKVTTLSGAWVPVIIFITVQ